MCLTRLMSKIIKTKKKRLCLPSITRTPVPCVRKIHSFIDCFDETNATVGIVTETWLTDGETLANDILDLAHGTGIGLICRNRDPNDRGVAHGGVAVASRLSSCRTVDLNLPNPGGHEVLCTSTTIPRYSRRLITLAC